MFNIPRARSTAGRIMSATINRILRRPGELKAELGDVERGFGESVMVRRPAINVEVFDSASHIVHMLTANRWRDVDDAVIRGYY
jgi:hypothetical protein